MIDENKSEHWTLRKDTFQKMKHITIIANPFQGKINIIYHIARILFAFDLHASKMI